MNYATIGSISHATMRTEDLLDAFSDELEDLVQRNADEWCSDSGRQQRNSYIQLIWLAREFIDESEPDVGDRLVSDLFDALNDFAAPYCYFGAHEGDGSDYGFWPSIESLEEDARDGEVLKISDLSAVPDDYSGLVMQVSDHGNVTLYTAYAGNRPNKLREIWSCV